MPSSARAAAASVRTQSRARRFIRALRQKKGVYLLHRRALRQGMLLCVPLRAAQLFVRCKSLDELGEALGRALEKSPQQDRTFLALHEEDWGTVIAEAGDAGLARLLSERFGAALSLELD